jgi:hypothetical protein
MSKYADIHEAARRCPMVALALRRGLTMDALAVALVEQNEMLVARVMELELVAPKKVHGPNGEVWIYRCPDALVP